MKGIATETIAKMLIVVIVVAIVVYIIYRYVLNSPLGEQECRAMMSTWCANCKFGSWQGSDMNEKLQECAGTYGFFISKVCNENAKSGQCKGFLPSTETTT